MQRFYKFIVVVFLLTANWLAAEAQEASSGSINSCVSLNGKKFTPSPLSPSKIKTIYTYPGTAALFHAPWSFTGLPRDYYLKMLGFVCKAEYSVEKKLNLPLALRVRAGSLDYVNRMEGKK